MGEQFNVYYGTGVKYIVFLGKISAQRFAAGGNNGKLWYIISLKETMVHLSTTIHK